MLMKVFDTSDYDRSLRRRRLVAFGLLAVGITGIVCYLLLIHDSDTFPEFARGFYLGGASGICIGSVFLLVRTTYLLSNPEARKKAKIQEQDEREKVIVNQAFQFAGMFTFFAAVNLRTNTGHAVSSLGNPWVIHFAFQFSSPISPVSKFPKACPIFP